MAKQFRITGFSVIFSIIFGISLDLHYLCGTNIIDRQ